MNSYKIIGICGKKLHGKDTIANYLVEHYGFTKVSFADALKNGVKEIFGFSDEQLNGNKKENNDDFWNISPREILQFVGTDCFRNLFGSKFQHIGDNIWVMSTQRKINNLIKNGLTKIVIPDIRFPNEIEFIKKNNGTIFKVIRTFEKIQYENKDTEKHISENSIDHIQVDYTINNNNLKQLYNDIDDIVNNELKKNIL